MQKIDGCNKMSCSKCSTYFCWICLQVLPHATPYSHFHNRSSKCFDKLFFLTEIEQAANDDNNDGDVPWMLGGADGDDDD